MAAGWPYPAGRLSAQQAHQPRTFADETAAEDAFGMGHCFPDRYHHRPYAGASSAGLTDSQRRDRKI